MDQIDGYILAGKLRQGEYVVLWIAGMLLEFNRSADSASEEQK